MKLLKRTGLFLGILVLAPIVFIFAPYLEPFFELKEDER